MRSILSVVLSFLVLAVSLVACPAVNAQVGPSTATKLIVYNASSKVIVMVGCTVPGVASLKLVRLSPPPTATTATTLVPYGGSGYFVMNAGEKWQLYNANSPYTLASIAIGFGQFPNQCPLPPPGKTCVPFTAGFCCPLAFPDINNLTGPAVFPLLPNGSNTFECNLNVASEAVDISCNSGANCTMGVTIVPPAGGPYWKSASCASTSGLCGTTPTNTSCLPANPMPPYPNNLNCVRTFNAPMSFQNSWVNVAAGCDNNCQTSTGCPIYGVYPYGCSQCNLNPDPAPTCSNANLNASCQVAAPSYTGPLPYTGQFCFSQNGNGKIGAAGLGCQLTRQAGSNGGTVQLTYYGPLTPQPCPAAVTPQCPSVAQ